MIFPIFAPQIVGNVLYVEENKPKKMKKINYLFIIFVLFLFVSCKSKKNVVSILPRPVLNVDSVRPDSSAAIDGLFAPDHSQLADLKVSTKKQKKTAKKEAATEQEERNLVLRGTKITSSTVNVPATYSGIDRVVEMTSPTVMSPKPSKASASPSFPTCITRVC